MGFLGKIEDLINKVLLDIGGVFARLFMKLIPAPLIRLVQRIKALPKELIHSLPKIITYVKETAKSFDFKAKFKETKELALAQYAKSQENGAAKASGFKRALIMPYLFMQQWVKGLSMTQTFFLASFTVASIFASVGMVYTGNKLYSEYKAANRAPASVEVEPEVKSERPDYYKVQARTIDVGSLRLPVFFSNINALKTVDIDFSAQLSNRLAKMKLEKLEFQLRDHLILQVEPMTADFPLAEEGKDILRDKLLREINDFMVTNGIEGEVQKVKLTYILSN